MSCMKTNTWKQYADAEILKQVTVRPIRPDEKARWDKLMSERHYLKNARLVGRQLRQVGELEGQSALCQGGGSTAHGALFSPLSRQRKQGLRKTVAFAFI